MSIFCQQLHASHAQPATRHISFQEREGYMKRDSAREQVPFDLGEPEFDLIQPYDTLGQKPLTSAKLSGRTALRIGEIEAGLKSLRRC